MLHLLEHLQLGAMQVGEFQEAPHTSQSECCQVNVVQVVEMDDVRLELLGSLVQPIPPARDEVSHLSSADSVKDTIGRARLVFIARGKRDVEAAGHRI